VAQQGKTQDVLRIYLDIEAQPGAPESGADGLPVYALGSREKDIGGAHILGYIPEDSNSTKSQGAGRQ
jgi:hypothetical protein